MKIPYISKSFKSSYNIDDIGIKKKNVVKLHPFFD
jgi:hypothetical protein